MEDIHNGNKVFTNNHGYEPIYDFGHYTKDMVMNFWKFTKMITIMVASGIQ
jgi:hypothetical protein